MTHKMDRPWDQQNKHSHKYKMVDTQMRISMIDLSIAFNLQAAHHELVLHVCVFASYCVNAFAERYR